MLHLSDVDLAGAGKGMADWNDENELVLVQRPHHDARVAKLANDAELHLAPQDEVDDLLRVAGPDEDANVRVIRGEAREEIGQHVRANGRRDPERQLPD